VPIKKKNQEAWFSWPRLSLSQLGVPSSVALANTGIIRALLCFYFILFYMFYTCFLLLWNIFYIFLYTIPWILPKSSIFSSIHNSINLTCLHANIFIRRETRWIKHHKPMKAHFGRFLSIAICLAAFNYILGKAQSLALLPRTIALEKMSREKFL